MRLYSAKVYGIEFLGHSYEEVHDLIAEYEENEHEGRVSSYHIHDLGEVIVHSA